MIAWPFHGEPDRYLVLKTCGPSYEPDLAWAQRVAESPIEWLFAVGLIANAWRLHPRSSAIWKIGRFSTRARPQVRIDGYRVDFLFRARGVAIAVELDGHDFHERTREQAERDKKRDRHLLTQHGIPTMRFTGSQVVKNARRCGVQVEEALYRMQEGPEA